MLDTLTPQAHVHPDMRVVVSRELGGRSQRSRFDAFGHHKDRLARASQLLECLSHAAFEIQARIEDDVGVVQLLDVSARRLEQMRIASRLNQPGDRAVRANHLLHDV